MVTARPARLAFVDALRGLAVALMCSQSLPALRDWSAAHPLAAALLLREYPLFPWLGLLLIGMVLGWTAVTERDPGQRARGHRVVGVIGAACLGVFALADRSTGLADRLAFARDLTLNDYWTAAPLTALGMVGGLLCLLAAAYELVERRNWRPRSLVVLGRTALMVYVVHLVLVLPVGVRAGGIVLSGWPAYWAATGGLLVLLVGLGAAWSAVRLTVSSPVWYKRKTSAEGRTPTLREGRVREA